MILIGLTIYLGVVLLMGVPLYGIIAGGILALGVLLFIEMILG